MKRGRIVLIWRVDLPFLPQDDWKYEASRAGQGRGGRTHTFGVKNPADIVGWGIVYRTPGIVLYRGAPTLINSETTQA